MLVVTIEVWPWGRAELKRKVGEITAGNIAGSGPIGTYEIRVHQEEYREPVGQPYLARTIKPV